MRSLKLTFTFWLALLPLFSFTARATDVGKDDAIGTYIQAHPDLIEDIVKDYLISHPEVIEASLREMIRQRTDVSSANDMELLKSAKADLVPADNDIILGNPSGPVTLIEFFDYNCHFCRDSTAVVDRLIAENPDLKVVLKQMPILGQGSMEAARIVAGLQGLDTDQKKLEEFHTQLMALPGAVNKDRALDLAVKSGFDKFEVEKQYYALETTKQLQASLALTQKLGLTGTPVFIAGNKIMRGAVGYSVLSGAVHDSR